MSERETEFTAARRQAARDVWSDELKSIARTLASILLATMVGIVGYFIRQQYQLAERISKIEGRLGLAVTGPGTNSLPVAVTRSDKPAEAAGSK